MCDKTLPQRNLVGREYLLPHSTFGVACERASLASIL